MSGEFSDLVDRLESVAADLDDVAFAQLREAVADGDTSRPANDKQLMQARRAIEKAARLLRQLDGDVPDDALT